jgi:fructose-specific component phosphotransferase system IIB-like protein
MQKIEKASEFLLMGEVALDGKCFDAAASLAAISAINASDVFILLVAGRVLTSNNHQEAVTLLRQGGYPLASTHLSRVLSTKNKAQYSGKRCHEREAAEAVKHAQRLYDQARDEIRSEGTRK